MLTEYQAPLSSLINHGPGGAVHSPGALPALAHRYGERTWLAKADCQRITQKFCNLTMETRNHTEFYYAKVTAVSPGGPPVTKMTDRFSSLQHSK